jgi:hypothetical protein
MSTNIIVALIYLLLTGLTALLTYVTGLSFGDVAGALTLLAVSVIYVELAVVKFAILKMDQANSKSIFKGENND